VGVTRPSAARSFATSFCRSWSRPSATSELVREHRDRHRLRIGSAHKASRHGERAARFRGVPSSRACRSGLGARPLGFTLEWEGPRYNPPMRVRPRMGQGHFTRAVVAAYDNECAVTASATFPSHERRTSYPHGYPRVLRCDNGPNRLPCDGSLGRRPRGFVLHPTRQTLAQLRRGNLPRTHPRLHQHQHLMVPDPCQSRRHRREGGLQPTAHDAARAPSSSQTRRAQHRSMDSHSTRTTSRAGPRPRRLGPRTPDAEATL
jgi:hypothetical protein